MGFWPGFIPVSLGVRKVVSSNLAVPIISTSNTERRQPSRVAVFVVSGP
jgi:hypothetical protein